jgi:type IV pilus assembly protein PilA
MIRKIQQLKAKKGFTLVELMVVIAIIGVLAAILIPLMNNFLQNARISSVNSTAATARNNLTYWLQDEDKANRGMRNNVLQTVSVNVTNAGTPLAWEVTFDGTDAQVAARFVPAYEDWDPIAQVEGGNVDALTSTSSVQDKLEAYVADYLYVLFPDAANCTFVISLVDGSAVAAVYSATAETNLLRFIVPTAGPTLGEIRGIANGRISVDTGRGEIIGSAPVGEDANVAT